MAPPAPGLYPSLLSLRQRLHGLAAALLLAIACLQAVGPIPAPLERGHGSAFSAATDDVAVVRPRASEAPRPIQNPVPLPEVARLVPLPATVRVVSPPFSSRPDSTGPPRPAPAAWPPAPRAPPRP